MMITTDHGLFCQIVTFQYEVQSGKYFSQTGLGQSSSPAGHADSLEVVLISIYCLILTEIDAFHVMSGPCCTTGRLYMWVKGVCKLGDHTECLLFLKKCVWV